MGLSNIWQAIQNDILSLPSTYEFKLKVNINIRWLHFLKFGYLLVLAVIMLLVYLTGGWNYKESGVSSVVTTVRGADISSSHIIWDAVDYVYPPQEVKAFFITTRAAITKQTQGICPDNHVKSECKKDSDCKKMRRADNGIKTGKCDLATKMCFIHGWCPVENKKANTTKVSHIRGAGNFTVYVRNHEEFIKFDISRSNDPNSIRSSTNCLYNPKTNPLCPIFRINDILNVTNVNFEDVRINGGVFQFYIKWHCYFNWHSGPCNPRYSFKRMAKDPDGNYAGYRMKYANFMDINKKKTRELITVYGLRFLIMIKSTGEQFRITSFLSNVGSYLSYFGIWTFITGLLCAAFLVDKKDLLTLDEMALKKIVRNKDEDETMINESVVKERLSEQIPLAENV